MRPVLEFAPQRAADQKRPEAGAIDEQVPFDPVSGLEQERSDTAVLPVPLDRGDFAFAALDPAAFRDAPQEARVERRIELVGIVDPIVGKVRELAAVRRLQLEAVIAIWAVLAPLAPVEPEVLEARGPMVLSGAPEAVEIAVANPAPVMEFEPQLERRLRRPHELGFVDA